MLYQLIYSSSVVKNFLPPNYRNMVVYHYSYSYCTNYSLVISVEVLYRMLDSTRLPGIHTLRLPNLPYVSATKKQANTCYRRLVAFLILFLSYVQKKERYIVSILTVIRIIKIACIGII